MTVGGVVVDAFRMALRTGDLRSGLGMASASNDKLLLKDCGAILEGYDPASTLSLLYRSLLASLSLVLSLFMCYAHHYAQQGLLVCTFANACLLAAIAV